MSGDWLAVLAATSVVATGAIWFWLIRAVAVPRVRVAYFGAMGVGVALGLLAFWRGTGIAGGVLAGFAVLAGGFFIALRLQSAQAKNRPTVEVGGAILDFRAPDDRGEIFELSSLRGRPFLLKFFRGHW